MVNWLQMRLPFTFLASAALALGACGPGTTDVPASTGCAAGQAMISVSDGYLETLCGCAEAAPVYSGPGSRLKCTVTSGTIVFFNYLATHAVHQIVSVGTPTFPSSGVSDPN